MITINNKLLLIWISESLKSGCSIDKASHPYNSSALPCTKRRMERPRKYWIDTKRQYLNEIGMSWEGAQKPCADTVSEQFLK